MLGRVPYVVDAAVQAMAATKHLILCGARKPVTFFAYPGKPHDLDPRGRRDPRAGAQGPGPDRRAGAPGRRARRAEGRRARTTARSRRSGAGPLTPESFATTVGALLPEGAIMADESITYGRGLGRLHQGLAAARLDEPQRRGDRRRHAAGGRRGGGRAGPAGDQPAGRRLGACTRCSRCGRRRASGWTSPRCILSNRKYQILLGELANVGANPGRTALEMMDLGNPDLNWAEDGRGRWASRRARADTADGFADLLAALAEAQGPVPDRAGGVRAHAMAPGHIRSRSRAT